MNKPKKGYTILILEGEEREPKFFKSIIKEFFENSPDIIPLSMSENIYMLYKEIEELYSEMLSRYNDENSYEYIQIIEIIKKHLSDKQRKLLEDIDQRKIAQIYLLFDCDLQHLDSDKTVSIDVIPKMLNIFAMESDAGKLYISYPQVESLRDWEIDTCNTSTGCVYPATKLASYREATSHNKHVDIRKYTPKHLWGKLLSNFLARTACLLDLPSLPSYKIYKNNVSPRKIYDAEKSKFLDNDKIFVLSGISEFLLEHGREKIWANYVSADMTAPRGNCEKKRHIEK